MAKKTEANEAVIAEKQESMAVVDSQESPASAPEQNLEPAAKTAAPAQESLAELANRYRVPAWQQAALLRLMAWAEGKQVTEADYAAALESLKNRRVGGGRVE